MTETKPQTSRVAIYARVSSEEQKEGQTIDSQVAELERYSKTRGWRVFSVYKDEGWSGAVMARPSLDRLRDDAEKGFFDTVLINDVDRLARDVSHLGIVKRGLEKANVEVVFRKLPNEKSPTQNLMVNILGSFAEFERELILDRTRRGRRHKVEVRKEYLGCRPPYGFRYLPADRATGSKGELQIVPEETDVVRKMYGWVAQEGLSARRVVKRLHELGIVPRKGGKGWARSTVLRIRRSEVYAGVWHYNKHRRVEPKTDLPAGLYRKSAKTSTRRRPKEEWIPLALPKPLRILPRDLWERVQGQLDNNITFSPRNGKHNYLLRGLIKCGGCRSAYVGDPGRGKYYYRCTKRCKAFPTIRENRLNETVWSAVKEAVLNPKLLIEQAVSYRNNRFKKLGEAKRSRESIGAEVRSLELEEERIIDAYRTSAIDATQLGLQLEKIQSRRKILQSKNDEAETETVKPEQIVKSIEEFCRLAARRVKTFSKEERQRCLRLLLTEVRILGEENPNPRLHPNRAQSTARGLSATRRTSSSCAPIGASTCPGFAWAARDCEAYASPCRPQFGRFLANCDPLNITTWSQF